jgi:chemotaxis protein CheD
MSSGRSIRPRGSVRPKGGSVRPKKTSVRPTTRGAPTGFKPTRGFDDVHYHWDWSAKSWIVQILPGEFYVSESDEIIATVLGSCVSTCIRDTALGVGGMNHFMLPEDPRNDTKGSALRYGCFALERLINELLKRGAKRDRLEIKVFGGGQVIAGMSDIGRMNIEFVRNYLLDEHLTAAVEDVGGRWARRLRYVAATGKALVKHLPMQEAKKVGSREQEFRQHLQVKPLAGEVELF